MRALIRKELWVIDNLRTVSGCMIDLRHIYNVANLIQFINIDTPYAQCDTEELYNQYLYLVLKVSHSRR